MQSPVKIYSPDEKRALTEENQYYYDLYHKNSHKNAVYSYLLKSATEFNSYPSFYLKLLNEIAQQYEGEAPPLKVENVYHDLNFLGLLSFDQLKYNLKSFNYTNFAIYLTDEEIDSYGGKSIPAEVVDKFMFSYSVELSTYLEKLKGELPLEKVFELLNYITKEELTLDAESVSDLTELCKDSSMPTDWIHSLICLRRQNY